MAEFDRPEVTLSGWQDVKSQLLANLWPVHRHLMTNELADLSRLPLNCA